MADFSLSDIDSMIEEASQGYDFSNYFTGGGEPFDFGQLDSNAISFDDINSLIDSSALDNIDLGKLDPNAISFDEIDNLINEASAGTDLTDYLKGGGEAFDFGKLDPNAFSLSDIDAMLANPENMGYYDEITGQFVSDPSGGLRGPLDEKSGTNIESMKDYTYDKKSGTWTTPSGQTYTPSRPPSHAAKSGAQVMVNAGALPKGYAGLSPEKDSTADLMAGKPGWSSNVKGSPQAGKAGQKSGLESLLPLLLMLLAAQRGGGGGGGSSNAVIPALTATQRQTPYTMLQQAPGYRPGQGGISYFNPVQYAPRMAAGGIADLERGRLLDGPGDGVSDSIPAMIGGMAEGGQPARLARGEYVIDARTVAALGNGSTDAGAERLDEMRRKILADDRKAGVGKDSKAYRHLKA